ncbi:hypothetical protein [Ekhidna sp.]|jgi:hypothetical protein|uniref:hypothetical protein n=1 Tax=Ekhidna sp. TaxID=2608089 RepID=UPI0032EF2DA7
MKPENYFKAIIPYLPYIIGVILVILIISKISKGVDWFGGRIASWWDGGRSERKGDLQKGKEKEVKGLKSNTTNLSFDKSYYTRWANKFYDKFNTFMVPWSDTFTKEEWDILQSFNKDELSLIVKEFGIKDRPNFWGVRDLPGNLFDWIEDEVKGEDLNRLKKIFAKTGLWGGAYINK